MMIPLIQKAIKLWSQSKGYAESDIKSVKVRYSDPNIEFHTFSFVAPCGKVMLKAFKQYNDRIKLIELK